MSNEQNSVGKLLMYRKLYTTNCSYGEREASPIEVLLEPGAYTVELWGASGGCDSGGKGAYARAIIKIEYLTTFYLFIGSKGTCSNTENQIGGCNGGGDSYSGRVKSTFGGSGGGSTDFRTSKSLESRILVAAGGGGMGSDKYGGDGGSDVGYDGIGSWSDTISGKGGTQEKGGNGGVFQNYEAGSGTLLYGGNAVGGSYSGGGGGGGYYGGGGSYETSGGGGSSFIFKSLTGVLRSGKEIFSSPLSGYEKGHIGDGYARITLIGSPVSCKIQRRNTISSSLLVMISFSLS